MKTLVIREYTGPLFEGGTEFGWREVEGGPIDWFNSTSNDDAYIQANLEEYRRVCGFEFEVEDWRRAGEGRRRELMNAEKYNIFRVTTCQVRNDRNEIIFEQGQVLQATTDLGSCWLARPVGSAAAPRMLPKAECRELTEAERAEWVAGN